MTSENHDTSGDTPNTADAGSRSRSRTRTRTTSGGRETTSSTTSGGSDFGSGSTRSRRSASSGDGAKDGDVKSGDALDGASKDGGRTSRSAKSSDGASGKADDKSGGDGGDDDSSLSSRRRRGRRGGRGRGGEGGHSADEAGKDSSPSDNGKNDDKDTKTSSSDSDKPSGSKSSRGGRNRKHGGKGTGSGGKGGGGKGVRGTNNGNNVGGGGEGDKDPQRGSTRVQAKKGSHGRRQVQGIPESVRRAMMDGPPKTMLVTSTEDRTQIAVLEERTVVEHYVTRKSDVTLVGNIYLARVQNVLPGMEAAFLDIGKGRNGVLYAGEVAYDDLDVEESNDAPRIEDVLKAGQVVLVQVTKDAMGTKGPRLTMELSLAGRYTVLVPNSTVFGISRKLTDKERDRLRKIVKTIKPKEHGVIVRTAGEEIEAEALTADVQRLLDRWEAVAAKAKEAEALTPVYEEPPLHVKVIRDMFGTDYETCIIDDLELHDEVKGYLSEVAPDLAEKIDLYGAARYDLADREAEEGAEPVQRSKFASLFDAYNASQQLQKAMGRKIWLKSGGYLIVESTEAMKVIDVNTGKFTGGAKSSLEEVVLKTNLEAAEEIVRQLRLRDMGGIIVIDFIDMLLKANRDQVVAKLERELLRDRTKTRVSDVSNLGLVQMTRKNVSQGLVESFSHKCESCEGHGYISELD